MSEIPKWSGQLANYYVAIRVDGRNKRVRRKYYRLVAKEKLRLAEQGICQECIKNICRYLAVKRLASDLKTCDKSHNQLFFVFT